MTRKQINQQRVKKQRDTSPGILALELRTVQRKKDYLFSRLAEQIQMLEEEVVEI